MSHTQDSLIAVLDAATAQAEKIYQLRALLAEWVESETSGPFFHEDEHGPDSLLHRTRKELE